jgi:hypothetical protein
MPTLITTGTPGFSDLPTALNGKPKLLFYDYSWHFFSSSQSPRGTVVLRNKIKYVENFRLHVFNLELVSKELNHFGVIAGLFRQIGGHSSRFVLF